nr:efflux RND transporter periplasmic adaptor subunit [Thioalkalivibrio sp.]
MRGHRPSTFAVLTGWFIVLVAGCGSDGPGTEAGTIPAPAVTVVQLEPEPVTETMEFVGRVTARERVELRARVPGFLRERNFVEGQNVSAGDRLFLIEPEPYQAVLAQREADLNRVQAEFTNARAQLRRGEELLKDNNIPRARVDELRAAETVAQAGIAQAEAALQAAQMNLDYTEVLAPIDGSIGLARYSVGNLVGPESGVLATLVQQDPIYVQFPLTQRDLLTKRRAVLERGGDPTAVVVHLRLADRSRYEHAGQVDFVDVAVDPGTDTVLLRSLFANPDSLLLPGQYIEVLVESGEPEIALLLPQSALQIDQTGVFVLVLDDEERVQVRRIETRQMVGARIVVKTGLAPGDRVVVEGVQKVRPGQTVTAAPWQPPVRD